MFQVADGSDMTVLDALNAEPQAFSKIPKSTLLLKI
jgi:hypothetical protein